MAKHRRQVSATAAGTPMDVPKDPAGSVIPNPWRRAGGRLQTPERSGVDLGSASAAPDGVRTITGDTELRPLRLLGPDPAKPGWEGRERLWKQSCSPAGVRSPGRRRFEATRGERRRQVRFGGWSAKGGPAEPCPQQHLPPSIGFFFLPWISS